MPVTAQRPSIVLDERRYRALIAANSSFVWRCAADGGLCDIDTAWLELVGLTLEQARDWGWLTAVHPDDREVYRRAWLGAVDQGHFFKLEYRLCCVDGHVRWFLDQAAPVHNDTGELIEWIGAGLDITERMESRRELEHQRERYRTLVESTSAILWEGDPETFRFTFVSGESETLLGYPPERWTDEPSFWLDHMHPADRDWAPTFCALATRELRQHSFDYRMIAADGRVVWLRDVVTVLAEQGRPVKLLGVMVDISSAKETAQALEYVSGLQQILVEISRALVGGSANDSDPVTEALARVGAYCEADRSYLLQTDGDMMTMTHEWCGPRAVPVRDELQQVPRADAAGQIGAMERREVLHLPCVAQLDESWQPEKARLLRQGVASMISVPVASRDRVWGAIGFSSDGRERHWNDQEIHALQALADVIGATFERDRAERARLDSEARLSAIAEHLPGAVFQRMRAADGRLRLSYLSRDATPGYQPEPAAPPDYQAFINRVEPEDRDRFLDALEHSARTLTPHDIQFRLRIRDGGSRWLRSIARPRAGTAGTVIWDGIALDETERIVAEQSLSESRALLEMAGRAARLGGWRLDPVERRLRCSDEVCAILEAPAGSQPSLSRALAYVAQGWRERVGQIVQASIRDGTPFDEEFELVTASGRRRWVRAIGEAVQDQAGVVVHVRGALQDITEGKRNEREVRRLAERLTTTLESITDAFFTVDRDWRFTYVNGEAERLLKRAREDLLGRTLWEEFRGVVDTPMEHGIRRALRDQHTIVLEEHYAPLDMWLEIHAYPSEEGVAVYFRDVSDRKQAEEDIQFLALYDPLTQLPNRRLLSDRLQHAMAACAGNGTTGAVAFLDVDDFKTLNDTLGHHVGDELLHTLAARLSEALPERSTIARFGGDEFAIVLPELHRSRERALTEARQYGERILTTVNRPYRLADHDRYTTVTLGLATFDGTQADSPHDVIQRADLAMYRAKEAGRSSMRVFEPHMRAALSERVAMESSLRRAIDQGRIVPFYQPQIDAGGRVIGAEALARWDHPERGLIGPSEFIPVAEQTGLILPLGQHMLAHACNQIATCAGYRPDGAPWHISVNISAQQFHQRDFVEQVRSELVRAGADPTRLRLELTESFLLQDVEGTVAKMAALQSDGVGFSLDDFGTGYSSLAYLKRLPLDQVKIDQAFVRDLQAESHDAAIVQAVVVLAENFGLEVIAEGVENAAIRDLLAAYGCRSYQGYLFSRPLPLDEFEAFVRDNAGSDS